MTDLQDKARRHLWLHFSQLGRVSSATTSRSSSAARAATSLTHGRRYLDGLSGLFVVQVGHGRPSWRGGRLVKPPSSGSSRCGAYGHEPAIQLGGAAGGPGAG